MTQFSKSKPETLTYKRILKQSNFYYYYFCWLVKTNNKHKLIEVNKKMFINIINIDGINSNIQSYTRKINEIREKSTKPAKTKTNLKTIFNLVWTLSLLKE